MPDTFVSLGGYTFSSWGVPERINGGGRQRLAIHQFIGGGRSIDVMGWVPEQIKFSGRLRGANASLSVRLLETLARVGVPVVFGYWTNRYQVVVSKLAWSFERFYEITYELTLEVLTDLTQDAWRNITLSVDGAVNSDLSYVQNVTAQVPQLTSGIVAITATLGSIGSLRTATARRVAPVVDAVSNVIAIASNLQVSLDAGLPVAAAGQVIAGGNPGAMAAALLTEASVMAQLAAAVSAVAIMTRVKLNLVSIGQ